MRFQPTVFGQLMKAVSRPDFRAARSAAHRLLRPGPLAALPYPPDPSCQGNRVKGSWSDEACEEFVVPCCGLASRAD
jgi:hypothetical protein